MVKCKKPKCFATKKQKGKASKCIYPNTWIVFRQSVASAGIKMSMAELKSTYELWLSKSMGIDDTSNKNIKYESLCSTVSLSKDAFMNKCKNDLKHLVQDVSPDRLVNAKNGLVLIKRPYRVKKSISDEISRRKKELSDQDLKLINDILPGSGGDIISEEDSCTVQRNSYKRLTPSGLQGNRFLNDEVLNMYGYLLNKQYLPKNFFFNSYFIAKLMEKGYEGVKRWSKKAKVDVFSLDKMLCLHNPGGMHWCLAVVHVKARRIEYMDSMGGSGKEVMEALYDYFKKEHMDKKKTPLKGIWTQYSYGRKVPQQKDGFNCGMFSLTYADFILSDLPFDFNNDDMPLFRQKMRLSMLNKDII